MLVCQCKWLTYKQLGDLVEAGVDTLDAIQSHLGAGTECGGCVVALQQYFAAIEEAEAAALQSSGKPSAQVNDGNTSLPVPAADQP